MLWRDTRSKCFDLAIVCLTLLFFSSLLLHPSPFQSMLYRTDHSNELPNNFFVVILYFKKNLSATSGLIVIKIMGKKKQLMIPSYQHEFHPKLSQNLDSALCLQQVKHARLNAHPNPNTDFFLRMLNQVWDITQSKISVRFQNSNSILKKHSMSFIFQHPFIISSLHPPVSLYTTTTHLIGY